MRTTTALHCKYIAYLESVLSSTGKGPCDGLIKLSVEESYCVSVRVKLYEIRGDLFPIWDDSPHKMKMFGQNFGNLKSGCFRSYPVPSHKFWHVSNRTKMLALP